MSELLQIIAASSPSLCCSLIYKHTACWHMLHSFKHPFPQQQLNKCDTYWNLVCNSSLMKSVCFLWKPNCTSEQHECDIPADHGQQQWQWQPPDLVNYSQQQPGKISGSTSCQPVARVGLDLMCEWLIMKDGVKVTERPHTTKPVQMLDIVRHC